ncbi:hypothetical protein FRC09_011900 [Ceratobasidium sp. 395]|nr:hypothetical protein FRC09_011900 [Ceratobasidium sp. 395]
MPKHKKAKRLAFTFDPPAGGDILLRSKDERTFCVHSVILGLASSVFLDMFSIGKPSGEAIQLDDDSESISLLLAFIYPSSIWPTISNIDVLEKCLEIGRKYNIEKIPQALDRDLSLSGASTGLIGFHSDLLRIFHLAATYGLRNCQTLAAKAITPQHIDLLKPAEVVKIAQEYPHMAHIIGLVGVQGIRAKILADVLFNFCAGFLPTTYVRVREGQASKNLDLVDMDGCGLMMCDQCASESIDLKDEGDFATKYVPSWIHAWSRVAYAALSVKPWDQCEHIFELSILNYPIKEELGICEGCVDAAIDAPLGYCERPGGVFEDWASGVKALLRQELAQLDVLYAL